MERPPKFSVVIPVYRSERIVAETLRRTAAFFENQSLDYEIIAVNDGSPDGTWEVLRREAGNNPHIIAIDLLRNSGQHTALLCGLQHSTGDYAITLDDDLQNPPEEIKYLIEKAAEGHDLVFGRFRKKQHARYRRVGSTVINWINGRVFQKPVDLVLSNFRLIRRDVVQRMCVYKSTYPYIPGLALMFAARPANAWVEHEPRRVGESTYTTRKIIELVMRILFSYSVYPLRLVSTAGMAIASLSLMLGIFYLLRAFIVGSQVPGWLTVVVLLSFFNGVTMLLVSILGEYTVRLLTQTSGAPSYHVREIVREPQEEAKV